MPAPTEDSGTYCLLPPHHRPFALVDDPAVGTEVAQELRSKGTTDDVWTFFGEEGIRSPQPEILHHGPPVAVVWVAQRLLTSACEYCDGLCGALRRGAHSFAYGEYWNFVPFAGAGHTVGSSMEVDEA